MCVSKSQNWIEVMEEDVYTEVKGKNNQKWKEKMSVLLNSERGSVVS